MSDDILKKYKDIPDAQKAIEAFEADAEKGVFKARGILRSSKTYIPLSKEERKKQFEIDKASREYAIKKAVPFISHKFMKDFILTQGLILVGARSGQSKSTTVANVAAGFITYASPGQMVKILSNEESSESVLCRIACIFEKLSFNVYHRKMMNKQDSERVENRAMALLDKVEVICEDDKYDMTCYEDVKAVLNQAAESNNTGMVILDYLQTVTRSLEKPDAEPVAVSKMLGYNLKKYGQKSTVPVLVFAQIKDSVDSSFKERIENDRTIYNHAFQAIEIIPDRETMTTTFKIHKDRHGHHQGKEVVMRYVDGRYEAESPF